VTASSDPDRRKEITYLLALTATIRYSHTSQSLFQSNNRSNSPCLHNAEELLFWGEDTKCNRSDFFGENISAFLFVSRILMCIPFLQPALCTLLARQKPQLRSEKIGFSTSKEWRILLQLLPFQIEGEKVCQYLVAPQVCMQNPVATGDSEHIGSPSSR